MNRKNSNNNNGNNLNQTSGTDHSTNVEESRSAPYSEDWRPYTAIDDKSGDHPGDVPSPGTRKKSYKDKRRAAYILMQDLNRTSDEVVSPEEQEAIKWAKTILPDFEPAKAGVTFHKKNIKKPAQAQAPAPSQPSGSKRKERVEGPTTSKRSRMEMQNRSLIEMAEGKVLLGVQDRNAVSGNVPREKWRLVENELQDRFLEFVGDSGEPPPMCTDAGWHQGCVKAIVCEDTRSAEIYKRMIESLGEVYPNARLVAVDWEQVVSPPKARAWVTIKPEEPEIILKMLQLCNPEIPTANWRVVKVEKASGPSRQVVLLLDNESADMVIKAGNVVRYGFTTIKMKVYGRGRKPPKPPPKEYGKPTNEYGKPQDWSTEERHDDSYDSKDRIDAEDSDEDILWEDLDED
ncbi:uncharacterized protein [Drosophila bipectinata]|uniref:uncharacterized protein n=1 Tax=Drosophila bipectinata TaxID=42026 RepID=UPI0038B40F08